MFNIRILKIIIWQPNESVHFLDIESFVDRAFYKYFVMFQLGKQEDAEEFLSYILDGLHEEMTTLIKFANGTPTGKTKWKIINLNWTSVKFPYFQIKWRSQSPRSNINIDTECSITALYFVSDLVYTDLISFARS